AHPYQRHPPPCTRHHRPSQPTLPRLFSILLLPQAQRGHSGRCPFAPRNRLPLRWPHPRRGRFPSSSSAFLPCPGVHRAHARFQARVPRGSWNVSRGQVSWSLIWLVGCWRLWRLGRYFLLDIWIGTRDSDFGLRTAATVVVPPVGTDR
ncbi:hypothetical protein BXZ70DRAFT_1066780, partial [Cristinia sonorae]